jgi:hypothetical protein
VRPHRCPSDTTDAEAVAEALLPVPVCQTHRGGRPEKHERRDIVDAVGHLVDNGLDENRIEVGETQPDYVRHQLGH